MFSFTFTYISGIPRGRNCSPGDDFSFQGTISARQNILKFGIDSKNKNYIYHFGTKLVDVHRLHNSLQKLQITRYRTGDVTINLYCPV